MYVVSASRRNIDRPAPIRYGYAAITWGNNYMRAIDEIAAVGYRGIQLRAGDGLLDRFGDKPAALKRPQIRLLGGNLLPVNQVRSSGEAAEDPEAKEGALAGAVPEPADGLLRPAPIALF